MKNRRNIAVVGCGHWGKNLIRNFSDLGSLYAVCDFDENRAQEFSDRFSVKKLSFKEINKNDDIKGVVIAVPAEFHASLALDSIHSGKTVYIEKPLAMNLLEAKKIITAAKEKNVHLMVGHLLQYHPGFIKLLEFVRDGLFGELSYISSRRMSFGQIRTYEDVIWSFAPHDISMILALANQQPTSVHAKSHNIIQSNICDIAEIYLDFDSKLKAQVQVSWLHPTKEQNLTLVGSKGMAIFDDTKNWSEKLSIYPHGYRLSEGQPILDKAEAKSIKLIEEEPLRNECSHFLEVVNGQVQPLTDGQEGNRVLNVLTASSKSLKLNKQVTL